MLAERWQGVQGNPHRRPKTFPLLPCCDLHLVMYSAEDNPIFPLHLCASIMYSCLVWQRNYIFWSSFKIIFLSPPLTSCSILHGQYAESNSTIFLITALTNQHFHRYKSGNSSADEWNQFRRYSQHARDRSDCFCWLRSWVTHFKDASTVFDERIIPEIIAFI